MASLPANDSPRQPLPSAPPLELLPSSAPLPPPLPPLPLPPSSASSLSVQSPHTSLPSPTASLPSSASSESLSPSLAALASSLPPGPITVPALELAVAAKQAPDAAGSPSEPSDSAQRPPAEMDRHKPFSVDGLASQPARQPTTSDAADNRYKALWIVRHGERVDSVDDDWERHTDRPWYERPRRRSAPDRDA